MRKYSNIFSIKTSYRRSIHIERDRNCSAILEDYIINSKSLESLRRFANAFSIQNAISSFTITGVYGTGKSVFVHFLNSLCAPKSCDLYKASVFKLKKSSNVDKDLLKAFISRHERAFIRASAVGRPEAIANTVVRALFIGCSEYYSSIKGRKPSFFKEIEGLMRRVEAKHNCENEEVLKLLHDILNKDDAEVLLVIDELGKNLEYNAKHYSDSGVYLLQQIAELPSSKTGKQIYLIGILHQTFSAYGNKLTEKQRLEWNKIQGRFEDIDFQDRQEHGFTLVSEAIKRKSAYPYTAIKNWSKSWSKQLGFDVDDRIFPIHPISVSLLPLLCARFGQNQRSLFSFLSSSEPFSFKNFLNKNSFEREDEMQTFKPHMLYDYFFASFSMKVLSDSFYQNLIEVQEAVLRSRDLDHDMVKVIKTIAVLNLVNRGKIKASINTLLHSLVDHPSEARAKKKYRSILDALVRSGEINYREKIDGYRLWEGSDINVKEEISEARPPENIFIASLLERYFPLEPLVASRHSYEVGCIRYLKQYYAESSTDIERISKSYHNSDAVIVYYIGREWSEKYPLYSVEGKALIVINASDTALLKEASLDVIAIETVLRKSERISQDAVARKEIQIRLQDALRTLKEIFYQSFKQQDYKNICDNFGIDCKSRVSSISELASNILSLVYFKSPRIWNEMINKNKITGQISSARRVLMYAMLNGEGQERLGLTGDGPESSIFYSLFANTGLYRKKQGVYMFCAPAQASSLGTVWECFEEYSKNSIFPNSLNLSQLKEKLARPPYGLKDAVFPLLIFAFLLANKNEVCLFLEGTYIPVIEIRHIEILLQKPKAFSIKRFVINKLRNNLLITLSNELNTKTLSHKVQNHALIAVIKPLLQAMKSLPIYAQKTNNLSKEAIQTRKCIYEAKEPDRLLFEDIPAALALPPLINEKTELNHWVSSYKKGLLQFLEEIQQAYKKLLSDCEQEIHTAFVLVQDLTHMQEELSGRCHYLSDCCIEPKMKGFINAAIEKNSDKTAWLESLITLIADKPAKSFTDEDVLLFKMRANDLARRFGNLELLQKKAALTKNSAFELRSITITKPDGSEINELLRYDINNTEKLESLLEKLIINTNFNKLSLNEKKTLLLKLSERIFSNEEDKLHDVKRENDTNIKLAKGLL